MVYHVGHKTLTQLNLEILTFSVNCGLHDHKRPGPVIIVKYHIILYSVKRYSQIFDPSPQIATEQWWLSGG